MNWEEYFNELAIKETEECKKVGWGSSESMYSKFNVAIKLLPLKEGKLLDIGCGTGAFERLVQSPLLDIHAIDISKKQIVIARQNHINLSLSSITNIPYQDSVFDVVTCFGVLQNFNGELYNAMGEMCRVLKNGGRLFVVTMDVNYEGFKTGWRKPNPILKYFIPEELTNIIEEFGVSVIKMGGILNKEEVALHQSHTFYILGEK